MPHSNRFSLRSLIDKDMRSLFKGSSWLFAGDFFTLGIGFIQVFVTARWLGVTDYGALALVITYVTIVNQIIDFRISEAATKYISEFWVKQEHEKVMATVKLCYLVDAGTGMLAFLLVTLSADLAARLILHIPFAGSLIILYAIKLLFSTVEATSTSLLLVYGRFSWVSYYTSFLAVVQLLSIALLLFLGYGLEGVLVAYITSAFVSGIVLLALVARLMRREALLRYMRAPISLISSRWKEIASFLITTNLNESFTLFTKNIDILILGYFRTTTEVGYYRLSKSLIHGFSIVTTPVYRVLFPQLSKLWSSQRYKDFSQTIRRFTVLMTLIILPVTLLVALGASLLISVTAGKAFLPAAPFLRIMLAGVLVSSIFCWVRPALLSMGKPGVLTSTNGFLALTLLVLSLFLVPLYGAYGSAILYLYPIMLGHVVALIAYMHYRRKLS
jgi:O-antigen/teichoic acid export membrane protein